MPCPFRILIIAVSAILALIAACLALSAPVELDQEGNPRQIRSFKQRMSDWYDDAVRPWLPKSWGGIERQIGSDSDSEVDNENENHNENEPQCNGFHND